MWMSKTFVLAFVLTACTVCANSTFGTLKAKLDMFIDDVVKIRLSLQDLRDNVSRLEQADTSQKPTGNVPHQGAIGNIGVLETLADDIETKIEVINEGFRDEKAALRALLNTQRRDVDAIARNVSVTRNQLFGMVEITTDIVTMINDILTKHIANTSAVFLGVSEDIISVKSDVTNALSADIEKAKLEVISTCSEEIAKIKSDVRTAMSNAQPNVDIEKRILDKVLKIITLPRFESSVYMFHSEKMNWSQAQKTCQEKGNGKFHLAEIDNKDEHSFVKTLAKGRWNMAWLGGTESAREGTWLWSTSGHRVLKSLWDKGEPNNVGGNEDCIQIYGGDKAHRGLNDNTCSERHYFVCELEL